MSRYPQPSVHRREGQSYWERLRELDAILVRRSHESLRHLDDRLRWLQTDPRSAAANGRG